MEDGAVMRVIVGLALVVAAILVMGWLARRAGLVQRGGGSLLRQVASLPLAPRQSVVVVQIEDTWLVLGVTPNQITTLHTLPAGELPAAQAAAGAAAGAFAQKLGQALKRR
ncbi:flagellar biosynthetic protein FliO [Bordetella genomosp. 1]|uniref:Flagellar protein n=1 Tax=Bordetella genomosp. 1 TaxID=1395607 RepID=A0A261SCR3_9BORD|nr:flagellar biosynthetic protein FliO [Bordetella genomosp. 1]OZI35136.1 flagellar biosynthetic protein FliO [Bordetella genomosp. 1]OZI63675.1 flagellar biosynthetic protein FliO [Bordetella genomosp. 1]